MTATDSLPMPRAISARRKDTLNQRPPRGVGAGCVSPDPVSARAFSAAAMPAPPDAHPGAYQSTAKENYFDNA